MMLCHRGKWIGGLLIGMFSVAAQAASADCPPLIPPLDMQKLFANPNMKPEDMQKIVAKSSRTLTKPATWSGCHTVMDRIEVQAPITIQPGTVLKFEENAGIDIARGGSLDASGTADKPITFTATDETTGYWYGLYFDSNSSHNQLIHTKVLYAGGLQKGKNGSPMRRATGDNKPPSRAIFVGRNASLTIEDSHVAHSGGYGLEILGRLRGFKRNHVDHTLIPMRIQPDAVGMIDADSVFGDSKRNQIDLVALGAVNQDATWVDPGVPYVLRYNESIDANLKLSPGVTILMGNDSELVVDQGSLNAVGTPDKPIVIRGMSQTPGFWIGLLVETKSADNLLRYVRVADAGGDDYHKADIYDAGHLKIEHSWVENSLQVGIVVNKNSGIKGQLTQSDITFKNNKLNYKEVD